MESRNRFVLYYNVYKYKYKYKYKYIYIYIAPTSFKEELQGV